jgi:4-alpha-glucanotransferase
MSRLTLLLAFHNHQPDGNFDHVFRVGYDDCYRPLLDAIAEFPRIKVALHHTGPLLEWLDAQRPAYLDDLRGLVQRGQVEILGGGFYEPMLAVLPDADADGQLQLMSRFCERRLGARPRGMWLAERVWEPALAERIARAGLRFTLIDDTHFRYAGMSEDLHGWYVTEKAGHAVGIFPIAKELRYAIPFMQVHETMNVLEELLARAKGRDVVATYGDDGEKFGMWPGTKEWVWEKGWLKGFFRALTERADHIVTGHFTEVVDQTSPTGRVYLPTASYEEMGEWTLPAEAQQRYLAARRRLESEGRFEEVRPFFRGGVWQGFMSKYPEANFMHKKMVYVSRKLARAETTTTGNAGKLEAARQELYRGQCNCAYWHGLFGGLYLNYLRHAVYSHLIAAESAADEALGEADGLGARVESVDLDADLRDEIVLSSRDLWVAIKPDQGGAFFELDVRKKRFNLANVLGRHAEGYHGKLREAAAAHGQHGAGAPRSIHDLAAVKESGLEELLHYDRHLRLGFIDHFLARDTQLDGFARSSYDERGDFAAAPYEVVGTRQGAEAVLELRRKGNVRDDVGRVHPVTIDKTLSLSGGRLLCRWRITTPIEVTFAPELSLTLLAGDDGQRRYVVPGRTLDARDARMASKGILEACQRLELVDEWSRFRVALEAGGPSAPDFWRFPLETASQSEGGFERTYQGSVIAPVWRFGEGVTELSLALDVSEL